jgi:hypothetical protein
MRSAVAAAMGLNVFHRQADKLYMCNIAQIVNVLHPALLTNEDKCIRTSTHYAFDVSEQFNFIAVSCFGFTKVTIRSLSRCFGDFRPGADSPSLGFQCVQYRMWS